MYGGVLPAQQIRSLCVGIMSEANGFPLIDPFVERGVANGRSFGLSGSSYDCRIAETLVLLWPGERALVSTIERFHFPNNICGTPLDKSSFARVFVSAFNTHFDAGFEGHATIELINHGPKLVTYHFGDPVCQFKFEWLAEPTELPYRGKYQNQQRGPQGARYE